jgi:flagellar basal-body rod protein FlgF
MDNAIYIALSRQVALFRDMAVTANNIANVNTTGYTGETMMFTDYLVDDGNRHKMAFAHDIATYRDTRPGPIQSTGNPLDMAIVGNAYFQVQTPQGVRYTKAGNFQMDGQGMMMTAEGYPVLDAAGQPVIFPEETTDIEVGESGAVKVNGEELTQLGVVSFPNEQVLERLAGSLFKADGQAQPAVEEEYKIAQGVLEGSNVNAVIEMTKMIETSRGVSSTAKFIEVMYDLQRRTSNILTKAEA